MSTLNREPRRRKLPIPSTNGATRDVAVDAENDLLALVERVRRRVDPDDMPPPLFAPTSCVTDVRRR